jgi:hypothetical protein
MARSLPACAGAAAYCTNLPKSREEFQPLMNTVIVGVMFASGVILGVTHPNSKSSPNLNSGMLEEANFRIARNPGITRVGWRVDFQPDLFG